MRLNRIDNSGNTITHSRKREGKGKCNEVAEKEKGVSVVQIQDGIDQVLQHPVAWRRNTNNVIKIVIGIYYS